MKLFARHDTEYFCFGTHTARGSDGHLKWIITYFRYDEVSAEMNMGKVLLEDFHGTDIGSTVAFEIHNGYFYAVTNQSTYEVEEVDWTSFYHCIRFPLHKPRIDQEPKQQAKRVYRRQHAEGAIHDSWTDLTLQHDEGTNDLYIVESRREWIGASSKQARSFYTARLSLGQTDSGEEFWGPTCSDVDTGPQGLLPENDILTTVLDSSHRATYMPTPKLYSWTRHPEFPYMGWDSPPPRSFILARTKFRAYNYSASAFIDLVEDGNCCPNRHSSAPPCLKLRIGSRRVAPAGFKCHYYEDGGHCYEDGSTVAKYTVASYPDCKKRTPFEDDEQYRYTPVRMWPPPPKSS
ncbi:hypothetical protein E8E13_010755 [Curvularia kusanoi]|uniref:Uncharacterized protein n=1 Tax=Curvularia kusanoi TaxID=90978 RepID=A0A9P4TMU5_CURKU|nr:hypothetical protein E8E13_010755 [Curvularia kusanoi]